MLVDAIVVEVIRDCLRLRDDPTLGTGHERRRLQVIKILAAATAKVMYDAKDELRSTWCLSGLKVQV